MSKPRKQTTADTLRNVCFILLGVAVLIAKGRYEGPMEEIVRSYAGNLFVSFAVYFWARIAMNLVGQGRFSAFMCAVLVVEAFEVTDGFGVMSNVFDPYDLLVNLAGVTAAFAVDHLSRPKNRF